MKTFSNYQEFLLEQHKKSEQNDILNLAILPAENLVRHLRSGEGLLSKFSKISEDLVSKINNVEPTRENINKIENELLLDQLSSLDKELTDISSNDTPNNSHFNIAEFVAQGYNKTSISNYKDRLIEARRLSRSINEHSGNYSIVIDSLSEFINKKRVFPRAKIGKNNLKKANVYISERNITDEERMRSNLIGVDQLIREIKFDTKAKTKRNIKRLSISLLSAIVIVLIALNLGAVVGATLAVLKVVGIIIIVGLVLSAISNG